MDGISKKNGEAHTLGAFSGLQLICRVSISHLFFVDDVLTFG